MLQSQRFSLALICLAIIQLGTAQQLVAEGFGEDDFRRLHAELQQSKDAPWRTIPWKIALLDARKTALAENKPIFIWAMDGHPLGCT
ncbi:MAG: hypothetical protein ACI9HK_004351 [Pirellulaceae bacterium]|jgi:hypothetical protein